MKNQENLILANREMAQLLKLSNKVYKAASMCWIGQKVHMVFPVK